MARIIPPIGSVADSSNDLGSKLLYAAIGVVDQKGKITLPIDSAFNLNPESWEEANSSGWVPHNINGQSTPVTQWTSGGPRMVSFDALVTNDISGPKEPTDIGKSALNSVLNAVGSIASAFAGVNIPPIADFLSNTPEKPALSIQDKLNFYRSLLYPIYDDANKLKSSPPLVVLFVGNTFTSLEENYSENKKISKNTTVWVVTNVRIKITKQLLNLDPMEALVSMQLMQYNIKSLGRDNIYAGEN